MRVYCKLKVKIRGGKPTSSKDLLAFDFYCMCKFLFLI